MVESKTGLEIPDSELTFTSSRSGGPGGQHANKTSTRVTLWFNIENSKALSENQKRRILRRLSNRIGKDGFLQVTSSRFRSQAANKTDTIQRFGELLRKGLAKPSKRRKTRVPRAERERRLEVKKKRSETKSLRRKPKRPLER